MDRPAGDVGQQAPRAANCVTLPAPRAADAASRPISSDTPTPSNWPARAWRSTSSNANSGTPTWDHLDLPTGHRPLRDHQRGRLPPTTDDLDDRRTRSLLRPVSCRFAVLDPVERQPDL